MKKVLIIDDHYVVRAGTSLILHSNIKNLEINQVSSYQEALAKVRASEYDLILLDIDLPDTTNKKMISELKGLANNVKILMYTSYTDNDIAIQYIREGADGFLNKMANEKEIVKAVNEMLTFGYYFPQQLVGIIAQQIKKRNPIEKLSERELQIFNLLTEGNGNLEISNIMGIKATTISTYKKRIFEKLDVDNLFGLMQFKKKLH
ncbi:response regulator transcription factor [Chryseobacterium sp. POL2]|uniref:response regulator transcription factor n=1 Tax=Chryseobacterium sp. POL2 TaxID=2713414 RepID=UPI0013E1300C|nr:response regulator transcription factor [Chryseobacterium sp. POL2]QIG90262.1 response regulator transcription factor [Chryseobacterium sp. POL2]